MQNFSWSRTEGSLESVKMAIPNVLNFYNNKTVTRLNTFKRTYEASEIIEDEKKLKEAVSLVRTFAKYPDGTALTDSFIESLKLLTDTIESQMKEVK